MEALRVVWDPNHNRQIKKETEDEDNGQYKITLMDLRVNRKPNHKCQSKKETDDEQ